MNKPESSQANTVIRTNIPQKMRIFVSFAAFISAMINIMIAIVENFFSRLTIFKNWSMIDISEIFNTLRGVGRSDDKGVFLIKREQLRAIHDAGF